MVVMHGGWGGPTTGFLHWRLLEQKLPLVWFIARDLEIPFRYVMIVKSNCLYPVLLYCGYLVYVLEKDIRCYIRFYVIYPSVAATSQDPQMAPSSTPARIYGNASSKSSPATNS